MKENSLPLETENDDDALDMAEGRGRRMDPELKTMSAMLRLLEDLPEQARARVVAWLQSRFMESV